jgi:hypothetical protein
MGSIVKRLFNSSHARLSPPPFTGRDGETSALMGQRIPPNAGARPVLSPELFDIIIDYLHGEKHALAACALVCSQFLPTSRYHLFGNLFVFAHRADAFVELLRSPHVTFPPYVRNLALLEARIHSERKPWINKALSVTPFRRQGIRSKKVSLCKWVDNALPAMRGFVNVKSLGIFFWSGVKDGSVSKLCPSLTNLSIYRVKFNNFDQVVDIICSYSNSLENLAFHDTSWNHSNKRLIDLPSPPSLKNLRIEKCSGKNNLIDWLLLHEHAYENINTLKISFSNSADMVNVSKLLKAIGSSLHHLSLRVPGNTSRSTVQWLWYQC